MLTSNDIALVRASFAQVVPIADTAADIFYDRLFTIAPSLRSMFPADMREQKRKLMQMIASTVDGLNNLDALVPTVKTLGARHAVYGVTASHYGTVGEALIWTLERGLGAAFTPEVRSAWAKLYGLIASTMQAGAAEAAVRVLDDRGAALDPVAAIEIAHAEIRVDRGVMDVAADHAVGAVAVGLGDQRLLELADIADRVLDLELRPLRERPVREAEPAPHRVENAIGHDREIVGGAAEQREPARLRHHQVEIVAVDDEVAPAVGAVVDGGLGHLDAAEMGAVIVAQELVVIARNVDDARALARLAQEFLHHIVVRLRPEPAGAQLPAVDDVADQIDQVGVVPAQEVEETLGLAAAGAEMHVGDEQRTILANARLPSHVQQALPRIDMAPLSHIHFAV